jgi:formylglycine-generating enzyme required for sulfatase activity
MRLIPAGTFVMGSTADGPMRVVEVAKSFYMSETEISNQFYRLFKQDHHSGFIDRTDKDHADEGIRLNSDQQPVLRISWTEATEFCRWLSEEAGGRFRLPSEKEWEYACRAGTDTPMWYGSLDADFSRFANLADVSVVRHITVRHSPKWMPCIRGVDDREPVTAPVSRASSQANPWGLKDMHGNVAEWTLSEYRPGQSQRTVRGGSWYDRPHRATSSFRLGYPPWQRIFNVGFRVVLEVE